MSETAMPHQKHLSDSVRSRIGQLYERNHNAMLNRLRRDFRFDDLTANEVISEVFEYLANRLIHEPAFEIRDDQNWLFRWAHSRAVGRKRQGKRLEQLDTIESTNSVRPEDTGSHPHIQDFETPDRVLLSREKNERRESALFRVMRDFVRHCEKQGKFSHKAVFELRDLAEWSPKDVAERLQLSVDRVHTLTFESRKWISRQLRDEYDQRGTLFDSYYQNKTEAKKLSDSGYRPSTLVRAEGFECLTLATVRAYADEEFEGPALRLVQQHLASCQVCTRLYELLKSQKSEMRFELQSFCRNAGALCPSAIRLLKPTDDPAERREIDCHIAADAGNCRLCQQTISNADINHGP